MVGEVASIGFAGGEEIRPDEAGVFAIPAEHIETARAHGLREAPTAAETPAQESQSAGEPATAQGEPQVDQQRRGKRGR
jgi:hypothetical protein